MSFTFCKQCGGGCAVGDVYCSGECEDLAKGRDEIAEAAELLLARCVPCDPETDRADCAAGQAGICDEAEACDFVRRHADLLAQPMEGGPCDAPTQA
jgi:hypothetical protein